jgi:hypothetical protein
VRRTKAIARDLSVAVTDWLEQHPRFGDVKVVDALSGRAGGPPLITGDFIAADGSLRDGFGEPFTITAQDSADHRYTEAVSIVSTMGTPDDTRDDWGLRFMLADGQWREFSGRALAVAPGAEEARTTAPAATAPPADQRPPAAAVPLDQAPAEAQASLDGAVTLQVNDMRAGDAAKWMGELTQVSIEIDPSLAPARTSFRFEDRPLRSAITELADQIGGQCIWRDHAIAIVPKASEPPLPRDKL